MRPSSSRHRQVQEHKGRKGEVMATVTDPVCGMEIDTDAAAASEEYQGKTYYFCSEGATSGLWPHRSSTPSERAVWSAGSCCLRKPASARKPRWSSASSTF